MMKLIKKAFKWYFRQFEEAYKPLIDNNINPWM